MQKWNPQFHGFLEIQMYIKITHKKEVSCYNLSNHLGSKFSAIYSASAQYSGLRHYPWLLSKPQKKNVTWTVAAFPSEMGRARPSKMFMVGLPLSSGIINYGQISFCVKKDASSFPSALIPRHLTALCDKRDWQIAWNQDCPGHMLKEIFLFHSFTTSEAKWISVMA